MSEHSCTIGQRFSQLSRDYNRKWQRINALRKTFDDDTLTIANNCKICLLSGIYDSYPAEGAPGMIIWKSSYDEESALRFEKVRLAYGLFEDTWIEVEKVTDKDGDQLLVRLMWA
jgi:hypothetical protein